MDLNGDGHIDILSGSYSRMDQDMAGLFQVLWGKKGGGFEKAAALEGTDGEPLIIQAGKENVTDKICTRPTAVDLDGDGHLDIVSGNFSGTFAFFKGHGDGKFEPKNTWLDADGSKMQVRSHSDPCFVDWDGDADYDLVTGSAEGGAYLYLNEGSAKQVKFGAAIELLKPAGHQRGEMVFGDEHITGPQADTRVFVSDVNGDGKHDLLIGDAVRLNYPAEGLTEKQCRAKLEEWDAEFQKLAEASQGDDESAREKMSKHYKARGKIVQMKGTGHVWVLYQK